MDENTKTLFKWKFYRLTVELNIIVLLVALSVPVFFLVHAAFTVPIIAVMLGLAIVLSFDFIRKYHETKAWLDDNTRERS